jgi:hypothetical protein
VPLRVSTISPTALNTYFFRARAAGNQTPANLPSAPSAQGASSSAPAAAAGQQQVAGAAHQPGVQQQQQQLHAEDVVQAVLYCLSVPDHVDVSNLTVRSVWAQ